MKKRKWEVSVRPWVVYLGIQISWLVTYSFSPGAPHFIQANGFPSQFFAILFSLTALFLLVSPAFPLTILLIIFEKSMSKKIHAELRFLKFNLTLSFYSIWWTLLLLAVILKFLEQVMTHRENFFPALVFAAATVGANFSAYWITKRFRPIGSK